MNVNKEGGTNPVSSGDAPFHGLGHLSRAYGTQVHRTCIELLNVVRAVHEAVVVNAVTEAKHMLRGNGVRDRSQRMSTQHQHQQQQQLKQQQQQQHHQQHYHHHHHNQAAARVHIQ